MTFPIRSAAFIAVTSAGLAFAPTSQAASRSDAGPVAHRIMSGNVPITYARFRGGHFHGGHFRGGHLGAFHGRRFGGFRHRRFGFGVRGPRFGYGRRYVYRHPYYGYGYGYGYPYYGYGYGYGPGLGVVTGAILGGALASAAERPVYAAPGYGNHTAYCLSRFKSYNPRLGTYLGFDGRRHPC